LVRKNARKDRSNQKRRFFERKVPTARKPGRGHPFLKKLVTKQAELLLDRKEKGIENPSRSKRKGNTGRNSGEIYRSSKKKDPEGQTWTRKKGLLTTTKEAKKRKKEN